MGEKITPEAMLTLIKKHDGDNKKIAEEMNTVGYTPGRAKEWNSGMVRMWRNRNKLGAEQLAGMTKDETGKPKGKTAPEESIPTAETGTETGHTEDESNLTQGKLQGIPSSDPGKKEVYENVPTIASHTHDLKVFLPEIVRHLTTSPAIEGLIKQIVKDTLMTLPTRIEVTEIQKSGRGGVTATTKKSFSLPSDLVERLDKLGGIASNHVSAALRLYFNWMDRGTATE